MFCAHSWGRPGSTHRLHPRLSLFLCVVPVGRSRDIITTSQRVDNHRRRVFFIAAPPILLADVAGFPSRRVGGAEGGLVSSLIIDSSAPEFFLRGRRTSLTVPKLFAFGENPEGRTCWQLAATNHRLFDRSLLLGPRFASLVHLYIRACINK